MKSQSPLIGRIETTPFSRSPIIRANSMLGCQCNWGYALEQHLIDLHDGKKKWNHSIFNFGNSTEGGIQCKEAIQTWEMCKTVLVELVD